MTREIEVILGPLDGLRGKIVREWVDGSIWASMCDMPYEHKASFIVIDTELYGKNILPLVPKQFVELNQDSEL